MKLPPPSVGVLWLSSLSLTYSQIEPSSPPVGISLKTPWSSPNLLLEILELIPKFNSNGYFSFIEKLIDFKSKDKLSESPFKDWSAEKAYTNSLHIIFSKQDGLLDESSKGLFEFYVAVHATAPAVHAYYQYYEANVIPELKLNNKEFDLECSNWVQVGQLPYCGFEAINKALDGLKDNQAKLEKFETEILPFDHIYHPSHSSLNTLAIPVIFYGDVESDDFTTIHRYLINTAEDNNIQYILRYKPPQTKRDGLTLSGYGVHLDLKSTEYKAVDDRTFDQSDEELEGEAAFFDSEYAHFNYTLINKLILDPPVITPLEDSNLTDIEYKTARVILSSSKPLALWSYLTQNFPKHAPLIAKKKNKKNQCTGVIIGRDFFRKTQAPDTILVNGVPIALSEVDIFRLLDLLKIEQKTIQEFQKLGVNAQDAISFLKQGASAETSDDDTFSNTFDVRDTQEGKRVVLWLNDLELDEIYESWPSGVSELTGGMFGGYLPEVRLNYASVLFAFDLSTPENLETIITDILPLVESKVPIRFGIIPLSSTTSDEAAVMSGLIHYFQHLKGRKGLVATLQSIYKEINQDGVKLVKVAEELFQKEFDTEFTNLEELKAADWYTTQYKNTISYMKRLNLKPDMPVYFVNGKRINFDGNYQRPLLAALSSQISFLRQKIYNSDITDDTNIYDFILSQPSVYRSYNPLIFGTDGSDQDNSIFTSLLGSSTESTEIIDKLGYLASDSNEVEQLPLISIFVSADLNSEDGKLLVSKALEFTIKDSRARITLIHSKDSKNSQEPTSGFSSVVYEALHSSTESTIDPSKLKALIESNDSSAEKATLDAEEKFWAKTNKILAELNLPVSVPFLIINGKLLKLDDPESIDYVDFETLCSYELNQRLKPIQEALTKSNLFENMDLKDRANLFMRASGILGQNLRGHVEIARFEASPGARKALPEFEADKCRLTSGAPENSWVHIVYILNPLSKDGQRWAPVLEALSNLDGVYLEGYLSPSSDTESAKKLLKRFYRFVLSPKLAFGQTNKKVLPPSARFTQLPTDALLTAGLDTISAWLVTPTQSVHDLDNIQLGQLGSRFSTIGVEAEFELKNLLVEGHARDITTQTSPRGLEFILGTPQEPGLVDTVVMANLGYFQLKANPGVFRMALRDGRSSQLYDIRTIGLQGLSQVPQIDNHRELILNSFGGAILFPRVSKKPGKEQQSLLGDDTDEPKSDGVWSSLSKKFFGDKSKGVVSDSKPVINVFTVASGHLYERFLSVMILSVIKNTNSHVKFWFIENFLSPSFKEFIPRMASHYGFDYELVTYQWPHWLNSQTEKQRIIWGYKILFLDVLFPLNVDKVIFVDADQVVRADLQELVDHDLKGAAYGYVPFCKSRDSMKGYRFWEQGYWADHLQGKPYHISALYVVDLKRFRALAAGDQLRGHYQMLSYDPNSLANLDQDLPNHLQSKMPIHSLPQEWLWCETWCDDASLSKAKTIDLCNNPETKEPKLDRARRILPEWQDYDNEIAPLRNSTVESKATKSSEETTTTPVDKQDDDKDEL